MRSLRNWLVLLALLPFAAAPAMAEDTYEVDVDFERVIPPMTGASEGKVEVIELFWYGCPHCNKFEPYLHAWEQKKPEYVDLVRVPAIFNRAIWRLHATAFYTAEVLGVLDKTHQALFDAIHQQGKRMKSEEELREFFVQHGVDGEDFDKTFNSFAVQAKVRRAADLTRRSGITGVPAVIINGRWRVTAEKSKSFNNMLRIIDYLAELEQKGEDASLQ